MMEIPEIKKSPLSREIERDGERATIQIYEGVKLENTLEEARSILISRGFTEIPRTKVRGIYKSPPTFQRNAETLIYDYSKRGLELSYTEASVNVSESERKERFAAMMRRARVAYAMFCASGMVVSSREYRCPPIESDGSFKEPATIGVYPGGEDVCHYNLLLRSGVKETLKRVVSSKPSKKVDKFKKKDHLSTF